MRLGTVLLLLHLSPLVLVLLVVVLLLPLIHVLLSLSLRRATASCLPVYLVIYHLQLLVHGIVLVVAVDPVFNFTVHIVSNNLFNNDFSAIGFSSIIFSIFIIIVIVELTVQLRTSLVMPETIESIPAVARDLVNTVELVLFVLRTIFILIKVYVSAPRNKGFVLDAWLYEIVLIRNILVLGT